MKQCQKVPWNQRRCEVPLVLPYFMYDIDLDSLDSELPILSQNLEKFKKFENSENNPNISNLQRLVNNI